MSKENLMPLLDPKNIIAEDGTIKPIKYRIGQPRNYRFDASKGIININGEDNLTKSGSDFEFIPVALRIFKDSLFERPKTTWAELFFINNSLQLCALMIHGYSVDNLSKLESELFYEDAEITDVIVKLKPKEKSSKAADGAKYFIAEFDFKKAEPDLLTAFKTCIESEKIYRFDTWKDTCEIIVSKNYHETPRLATPETEIKVIETAKPEPATTTV